MLHNNAASIHFYEESVFLVECPPKAGLLRKVIPCRMPSQSRASQPFQGLFDIYLSVHTFLYFQYGLVSLLSFDVL